VKNEFASSEMDFLGHVLSREGVMFDPKKIELIKEWQSLVPAKGVRSFLGLANLYRKFIKDFLALAKLPTNLLKKEGLFKWKGKQQKNVRPLKREFIVNTSVAIHEFHEAIQSAYGCKWVCMGSSCKKGTQLPLKIKK
jgi:hypothetical protein